MKTNNTLYLHIGETQTEFVLKQNDLEQKTTVNLGWKQVAADFFSSFPPTYDEVDRGINYTEEALAELEQQFAGEQLLTSFDEQAKQVWQLAFNTSCGEQGDLFIPQVELENVFDRFAAIVKGLPASQDVIPGDVNFAAYLLIIREVMHHLDFGQLQVS